MKNFLLLIILFYTTNQVFSQTINWIGQSKKIIERNCIDAGFKLFSDEINEQKYEIVIDEINSTAIYLIINYENNYCNYQSIMGKSNENNSANFQNVMKKLFCETWQEIDSKHLKCGETIANQIKTFSNGRFVYTLWW